jgi:hypothetical protein
MSKAPKWFSVVSVLALAWNLIGCAAFAMDMMTTPEDVAKFTPEQQELYAARGTWVVVAYAAAVVFGALGSLALVLRRRWAVQAFVLSLLGVVVMGYGLFVVVDGLRLGGAATVITQGLVFTIGVALLLLGRKAVARGWLA